MVNRRILMPLKQKPESEERCSICDRPIGAGIVYSLNGSKKYLCANNHDKLMPMLANDDGWRRVEIKKEEN
jgi:hypothetical protein